MSKTQILLCPGPVNVAENIKQAIVENEIGHREKEFSALLQRIQKKILQVLEVKNPRAYMPVIVTGSGTAANESVLSSIVGNKHILVLSNGEFGDRIHAISKIHNPNTHYLPFGLGNPMDLKRIEQYIKENNIEIVAMVHHETCVGLLNPIDKVGRLAKKYNLTFFVDCVSSATADKVDIEKWNITFMTTSAAKALSSVPGLSIVVGKRSAFEALKNSPQKTMYLYLYNFYHYAKKYKQTPNTPAVPLFFALEKAIDNILVLGPQKRRLRLNAIARTFRSEMKRLGLTFLPENAKDMSNILTTVKLPPHINTSMVKSKMREKNIIIYDGKGPLQGKVFQVANIGEVGKEQIQLFLETLQEVLVNPTAKNVQFKKTTAFSKKSVIDTLMHPIPVLTSSTKPLPFMVKKK